MPRALARFAVVGSAVTAVDVGLFAVAWRGRGGVRRAMVADVPALLVATVVSHRLHRAVTFRHDPYRRWLAQHEAFTASAVVAGAVDVATTAGLAALGGGARRPGPAAWWRAGLAAKVPAVAVAGGVRWILHRRVLFRIVREGHVLRPGRPDPPGDVRLSVVLPAYEEATRIGAAVATVREALAGVEGGVEIVVVDDGSADATAEVAAVAGADRVVVLAQNRGKGAAVRAGSLVARGRTIAFTDADLAYAPDQMVGLLHEVERGWDLVVGSRRHDQTAVLVRARRLRELGGRVINWLTHAVLLGAYRDTQCGLKAFRSDAARSLFAKARIDGFAFDVELFVLAERNGLSVSEVPVRVANSERSTVHVVRDAARLVRDLLRIRRWAREGRYQLDAPQPAPVRDAR